MSGNWDVDYKEVQVWLSLIDLLDKSRKPFSDRRRGNAHQAWKGSNKFVSILAILMHESWVFNIAALGFSKRMVVIWRSAKKQPVSSTLHSSFPILLPNAPWNCCVNSWSKKPPTDDFLMLDHFWWSLNIFDDVWNGFSYSGWLRACQAQQELLNVVALVNVVKVWCPLEFNEG